MKKIEHSILIFIVIEAIFTLFFIKLNYLEIFLGFTIGILLIIISNLIPKNNFYKLRLFLSSFIMGFYILYKVSNFIKYNLLPSHSIIIIIISLLLVILYLVKKGYHVFIKSVEIASYFFMFFKLISFILLIPKFNISNLENITYSINYHFIYLSFAICLVYNSIYYITNNKPSIKIFVVSLINSLLIKTTCILVLGNSLTNIYNYPYLDTIKKIKYLDFIERCDGILSFEYLICFYILISSLFLTTKLIYNKKS